MSIAAIPQGLGAEELKVNGKKRDQKGTRSICLIPTIGSLFKDNLDNLKLSFSLHFFYSILLLSFIN